MPAQQTTTVDLIRHGEPVGGRKYRGQIDDPLSERGWAQMRAAVSEHRPWDAILSSTLSRCAAFAEELAGRHGLPLQLDERLKEIGFGSWEGRSPEQLLAEDPERLARFWADPLANTPPGAEPLAAFAARIGAAWQEAVQQHRGRHLLIVCHAGTVRLVLQQVLALPLGHVFRVQVPNAGITRVRIEHQGQGDLPRLIFHAGNL